MDFEKKRYVGQTRLVTVVCRKRNLLQMYLFLSAGRNKKLLVIENNKLKWMCLERGFRTFKILQNSGGNSQTRVAFSRACQQLPKPHNSSPAPSPFPLQRQPPHHEVHCVYLAYHRIFAFFEQGIFRLFELSTTVSFPDCIQGIQGFQEEETFGLIFVD